ncbi:MAG: NAD(P)H-dependent glycerol-3-phosphate dehydrogenase [Pseudomonadota bacterium]|jgi:glycerol-3-phosphate dehydrogenase (NAD(P)+)
MKIIVIGAGAWGTALAIAAAQHPAGHCVELWARDAGQAALMQAQNRNDRYLPGVAFPSSLTVAHASDAQMATLTPQHHVRSDSATYPFAAHGLVGLCIVATPIAGLRTTLQHLRGAHGLPLAWLCKGFEAGTGCLPHEIQAQVAPAVQAGALSGPSFAQEVALGQPTALVAASHHTAVREALVAAFHHPQLRVYANSDLVGVEVGGAVKNVLALATGLCDGLQLGLNARAALITRGLAEMTRLGLALGARSDTFMGLSGLGDLVLTATGDLSRNRQVGLRLAQGLNLKDAVASLGHVAEGVYSARTVLQRAQSLNVEMPVVQAVVDLLDERTLPTQAVAALMGRGAKPEYG